MGLFDNIRSKTDSTTARLLFGAVVVVFVFSFIGGGMGGRTATYATVNGSRITDLDLQKRMRMVQRQMQSSSMNEDELQSLQNDILERLVVEKAVMDRAKSLSVEVSDDEISLVLLSNPGFKDAAGDFSPELYEQAVKQEGYGSKAKYEERLREDLVYSKLREQIIGSVYVSDDEARIQALKGLSTLNIDWIRLNETSVQVAVTPEEAQSELENNKTEIEAQYNADLPFKYQKGERVTFQRITLPFTNENKDEISGQGTEILSQLSNGTDFSSILSTINPGSINNGIVSESTREQLDIQVANVLFELEVNAVELITTDNAIQIVKLLERKPAETISFDAAGLDIATDRVKATKQKEALSTQASTVLEQWKNGFSPETAALYPVQSESDISMVDPKVSGLGNNPMLFAALASVENTGWIETPFPTLGGVVLVKVTAIQKPSDEQLTECSKLEKMKLKIERQRNLWDAFESNARATAKVEEHWKTWNQ
jgi:peptidyl-prolyl cis-trans isomerase D